MALATTGAAAIATMTPAAATAEPDSTAHTVTAATSDGSTVGWTIPDAGVASRGSDPASLPTFETTSTGPGEVSTVITIPNAQAPRSYSFDLSLPGGATATGQEDGSVSINNFGGKLIGGFKAPWAKDANGVVVPTSLSVSGGELTQRVEFGPTTEFPVTADPSFTWGIVSGHVYFNRSETRLLALGAVIVSWIPTPATIWGGRALSVWAGIASATNQCVYVKVGGGAPIAGIPVAEIGYHNQGYCT